MKEHTMMSRWTAIGLIVAPLALLGTACADDDSPLSVADTPQVRTDGTGARHTLVAAFISAARGNGNSCDPTAGANNATSAVESAMWIDERGGAITIAGYDSDNLPIAHTLTVPEGAVPQRTLFCMRLTPSNHMTVEVTSYALNAVGDLVDVGAGGFQKPLTLELWYAGAPLDEHSRPLRIVSVPRSGPVEQLTETAWAMNCHAVAELRQLSRQSKYALALD
jgi:hypothetical protein